MSILIIQLCFNMFGASCDSMWYFKETLKNFWHMASFSTHPVLFLLIETSAHLMQYRVTLTGSSLLLTRKKHCLPSVIGHRHREPTRNMVHVQILPGWTSLPLPVGITSITAQRTHQYCLWWSSWQLCGRRKMSHLAGRWELPQASFNWQHHQRLSSALQALILVHLEPLCICARL